MSSANNGSKTNILVFNAGSSSHKSSLYCLPDRRAQAFKTSKSNKASNASAEPIAPLWEGSIDFSHHEGFAELTVRTAAGQLWNETLEGGERAIALERLVQTLWQGPTQVIKSQAEIHAIGHRVVHGGQLYHAAALIDETLKGHIRDLSLLAPIHNPANLAGIDLAQSLFDANLPQFAVFDTAFHGTLPPEVAHYPVPQAWVEMGIRRYGFHGISHQYCAQRAAALMEKPLEELRLVIAHLGNGCSLCAVRGGRSIDTTMGFTPLDGLMMGSRSGSIDPSILTYLMRTQGYDAEQLDQQLNQESGLKGVSGLSADMREIVEAMQGGHGQAKLAFDLYIHRLRSGIAAMVASLGGLDGLIFTGGVGEHATLVRSQACEGLAYLNIEISEEKNMARVESDHTVSSDNSPVPVWVIHTQEDWQIAQTYWDLARPEKRAR
jgi:acetate kinase